jgi:hypothetical protein
MFRGDCPERRSAQYQLIALVTHHGRNASGALSLSRIPARLADTVFVIHSTCSFIVGSASSNIARVQHYVLDVV